MSISCWTLHKCTHTLYWCLCLWWIFCLIDAGCVAVKCCIAWIYRSLLIHSAAHRFSIVYRLDGDSERNAAADILLPPSALVLFCEGKWLCCRIYAIRLQKCCLGFQLFTQECHCSTSVCLVLFLSVILEGESGIVSCDFNVHFPGYCGGWAPILNFPSAPSLAKCKPLPWPSRGVFSGWFTGVFLLHVLMFSPLLVKYIANVFSYSLAGLSLFLMSLLVTRSHYCKESIYQLIPL